MWVDGFDEQGPKPVSVDLLMDRWICEGRYGDDWRQRLAARIGDCSKLSHEAHAIAVRQVDVAQTEIGHTAVQGLDCRARRTDSSGIHANRGENQHQQVPGVLEIIDNENAPSAKHLFDNRPDTRRGGDSFGIVAQADASD
jgi:hypothetical protein